MPVPEYQFTIAYYDERDRGHIKRFTLPCAEYGIGDTLRVIYEQDAPEHAELLSAEERTRKWRSRATSLFVLATVTLVLGIGTMLV